MLSLDNHELTTSSGIRFTLPFQNINWRSVVRVVDFFPSDLEDFAVRCARTSEFDALSEREDEASELSNDSEKDNNRQWEWRFGLVLEDAKESKVRMRAYVADQDAVFLLKLDAEE